MVVRMAMVGWLALVLTGCGDVTGNEPDDYTGQTGLALKSFHKKKSDVAKIEFTVDRVPCSGHKWVKPFTESATEKLEKMTLPGGIPDLENAPLDEDSEHKFADHYFVLKAGCYNVWIKPLNKWGKPSGKCAMAWKEDVVVVDGKTTEVMLISQCEGAAIGGLDVIGLLNYPPMIMDLAFDPSKFVDCNDKKGHCHKEKKVCVTASDPDGDPLMISWTPVYGPSMGASSVKGSSEHHNGDGSVTQCMELEFSECGAFTYEVTVYDLIWYKGEPTPVEQWLDEQGYPAPSHDSLEFPIYVACPCSAK